MLFCSTVFALVAATGCGKGDDSGSFAQPALSAAHSGAKDSYAGDTKAVRTDDTRPVKDLAKFPDANAAKEFVDSRKNLDPKDASVRDQLIALLSFWDDTSPEAMKTSVHVRNEAAKILKKGAPFTASEQASLLGVVASQDPNAALLALEVLLEQRGDYTPDSRTGLIFALSYWNGSSKTYASESAKVRKEAEKGVSRLLPLSETEQGLVMDGVEKKDPFVAVIGLELLKEQKMEISGSIFPRIKALAKYSNEQTDAYAKESAKVRKLVAEILK
jgi:hypothetical protein